MKSEHQLDLLDKDFNRRQVQLVESTPNPNRCRRYHDQKSVMRIDRSPKVLASNNFTWKRRTMEFGIHGHLQHGEDEQESHYELAPYSRERPRCPKLRFARGCGHTCHGHSGISRLLRDPRHDAMVGFRTHTVAKTPVLNSRSVPEQTARSPWSSLVPEIVVTPPVK